MKKYLCIAGKVGLPTGPGPQRIAQHTVRSGVYEVMGPLRCVRTASKQRLIEQPAIQGPLCVAAQSH